MKNLNLNIRDSKLLFALLLVIYVVFLICTFSLEQSREAVQIATIVSPFFALIGYFIVEDRAERRSILERSFYYRKLIDDAIGAITLQYKVRNYKGEVTPHYLVGERAVEQYFHWLDPHKMSSDIEEASLRPEKLNPVIIFMAQLTKLFKENEMLLFEEELSFYHRQFQLMGWMNEILSYLSQNEKEVYMELEFTKLHDVLRSIIERKESR